VRKRVVSGCRLGQAEKKEIWSGKKSNLPGASNSTSPAQRDDAILLTKWLKSEGGGEGLLRVFEIRKKREKWRPGKGLLRRLILSSSKKGHNSEKKGKKETDCLLPKRRQLIQEY